MNTLWGIKIFPSNLQSDTTAFLFVNKYNLYYLNDLYKLEIDSSLRPSFLEFIIVFNVTQFFISSE